MNLVFSIFFLAILFIVPFLGGGDFFASPESCGFVAGDVFLFLTVLLLPHKRNFFKLPLFCGILIYMFVCDTVESYACGLFYGVFLFATLFTDTCKKKIALSAFFYLALFVLTSGVFFFSAFSMDLKNIWSAASFYWWGKLLFIVVPLAFTVLNLTFLYRFILSKNFCFSSYKSAILLLLSVLGIHAGANVIQHRQPILEFSAQKFFWQICTPGVISQSSFLNRDTKERFEIWDSQKSVFDFDKPTVFVLMESWGVNQSTSFSEQILSGGRYYSNVFFEGIAQRKTSFTQGAEWEDFNKTAQNEDLVPVRFKENGFETWFIHGYDGDFYNRKRDYGQMGFDSLKFIKDFSMAGLEKCKYGFSGICDSSIVNWLDQVLLKGAKKFVYWTTLDSHPPYEGQNVDESDSLCKKYSLNLTECVYLTRQSSTIRSIQQLAKKHPDYRFVLKGDHRPMGSMQQSGFVSSFYYKWVPLVILNK